MKFQERYKSTSDMTLAELRIYTADLIAEKERRDKVAQEEFERKELIEKIRKLERDLGIQVILDGSLPVNNETTQPQAVDVSGEKELTVKASGSEGEGSGSVGQGDGNAENVKPLSDLLEFMHLVDKYLSVSGVRGLYHCGESNRLHKEIEWWLSGKPKPSITPLLDALASVPGTQLADQKEESQATTSQESSVLSTVPPQVGEVKG